MSEDQLDYESWHVKQIANFQIWTLNMPITLENEIYVVFYV